LGSLRIVKNDDALNFSHVKGNYSIKMMGLG